MKDKDRVKAILVSLAEGAGFVCPECGQRSHTIGFDRARGFICVPCTAAIEISEKHES